mmetsp:Transcript_107597/g.186266  ORF Transcript_107597/g.186266 Transcript_107597/m.186266 type:complete len:260 (+) Transcript_107597:77-856(+)
MPNSAQIRRMVSSHRSTKVNVCQASKMSKTQLGINKPAPTRIATKAKGMASKCTRGHGECVIEDKTILVIRMHASMPITVIVSRGVARAGSLGKSATEITLCSSIGISETKLRSRLVFISTLPMVTTVPIEHPIPMVRAVISLSSAARHGNETLRLNMSSPRTAGSTRRVATRNSISVMPTVSSTPPSRCSHCAANQTDRKPLKPQRIAQLSRRGSTTDVTLNAVRSATKASKPWSTMLPSGVDCPVARACLPSTASAV